MNKFIIVVWFILIRILAGAGLACLIHQGMGSRHITGEQYAICNELETNFNMENNDD